MPVKIDFDDQIVEDVFMRVLIKSVFKIQELAKRNAPVDTGHLRRNIKIIKLSETSYVVVSEAPYSASMEFGSRPHWTSAKNLKLWARRKLGDENAAYAVAAKIARKGSERHPFMVPALMEVKNIWVERFVFQETTGR